MIYACYVLYNEVEEIADSLRSINGFADRYIFIDGAFEGHPLAKGSATSTDGTIRLLESLIAEEKRTIVTTETAWRTQTEARNQYLRLLPLGSWAFIIDADEMLHGDREAAKRQILTAQSTVLGILIESLAPTWHGSGATIPRELWPSLPKCPIFGYSPRFYRSSGKLAYRNGHSCLWDGDRMIAANQGQLIETGNIIRSVRIVNDMTRQSWERYQEGITYRRSAARQRGE